MNLNQHKVAAQQAAFEAVRSPVTGAVGNARAALGNELAATDLSLAETSEVVEAYNAEVKHLKERRTVTVTLHTGAGNDVVTAFYPHQFDQALEFFRSYIEAGKHATITNVIA